MKSSRLILPGVIGLSLLPLLLAACQSRPVEIAALVVPTMAFQAQAPALSPTPSPTPSPSQTPLPSHTPSVTPTPSPSPIPVGGGVNPLLLDFTPRPTLPPNALLPTAALEWRPPPLPVPVSIHPEDHYWFARPIPSDRRNYDLEYYPYGNDILIPEYAPYRVHHGLDYPNDPGTPVLAAGSGEVIWAGPLPSPRDGFNNYGNTVIIRHDWQWRGEDVYTLYAHTLELFVKVGDRVATGQLLAGVGDSGLVTGPHLHFEVRVGDNNYNATRNPSLWLAPYEGWGTLAGRFVDRLGEPIGNAELVVTPLDRGSSARVYRQRTYMERSLVPDEVWNENFVIGDIPAGTYRVELFMTTAEDGLRRRFTNTVRVLPGRTNYLLVQADFIYVPTPTPTPSPTPAVITATTGISGTTTLTETIDLTPTP